MYLLKLVFSFFQSGNLKQETGVELLDNMDPR